MNGRGYDFMGSFGALPDSLDQPDFLRSSQSPSTINLSPSLFLCHARPTLQPGTPQQKATAGEYIGANRCSSGFGNPSVTVVSGITRFNAQHSDLMSGNSGRKGPSFGCIAMKLIARALSG